jgi:basic amino acid/polyamine antiporter, APA family
MNLFRKKPMDQLLKEVSNTALPRKLGAVNLTLMGIGAVIGAGIFSLPGFVAAKYAGPSVILSFGVAAFACALAALCYAEIASMVPVAGSAYTYTYATIGLLPAWIMGWDLVLEYAVGAAVVAISWSQYLTEFLTTFNLHIPDKLIASPGEGGLINLPAVAIIFAISILLTRGINVSARVNTFLVVLKVVVILVFIRSGWFFIQSTHYSPFIPRNAGEFGQFGWSGVFKGAAVVFFAFLGFDAISATAQEVKNPQRTLPIGLLGSIAICTILYMLFSYVFIGLVDYRQLSVEKPDLKPVLTALSNIPALQFLKVPVNLAILLGYIGVMMITLLAQSRIFFAMSKDRLVPPVFSSLDNKLKTPLKSHLLFALFTGAVAGFTPKAIISDLVSIGALFAFAMVCAGVMILRYKQPNLPRRFKVPFYPIVPVLGIVSCIALMFTLPIETWWRLIVWMVLGMLIFFVYGIWRIK